MAWEPVNADNIRQKWQSRVKPRFDDFFNVLTTPAATIPNEFLDEQSRINGKTYRNFLELFLRTQTAKQIIKVVRNLPYDERVRLTHDVFEPYWKCWDELFTKLAVFYGKAIPESVASPFRSLKSICCDFENLDGFTSQKSSCRHENLFETFCLEFSKLPRKGKSSKPASFKFGKYEFVANPLNGKRGVLSPYARKILDTRRWHHLTDNALYIVNRKDPFLLTGPKAWNAAIFPLLTECSVMDGEDGWVRLPATWQTYFRAKDYVGFAQLVQSHTAWKTGKKLPGRGGDRFYRLTATPAD